MCVVGFSWHIRTQVRIYAAYGKIYQLLLVHRAVEVSEAFISGVCYTVIHTNQYMNAS